MDTPLRVLILEDHPFDADLMVEELLRGGFEPDWQRVDTEPAYLDALDPTLDLILADYSLPQFDAMQALDLLEESGLDIPFIVVTGVLGDEAAAECIKQGAVDFLLKDRLARLSQAVVHAIKQKRLRDDKRQTEERFQAAQTYSRNLVDSSSDMIFSVDNDRRIVEFNRAAQDAFGYDKSEVVGKLVDILYVEPTQGLKVNETALRAGQCTAEVNNKRKNGEGFISLLSASLLRGASGEILGVMGASQDITERKRMEEELRLRNRELEALFNIASILADSGGFEEKATRVVEEVAQVAEADSATLRVPDEKEGGLRLVARTDHEMFSTRPLVQRAPKGLSVEAFEAGIPVVANDYPSHPNAEPSAVAQGSKSMIALPIKAGEHTLGVVTVVSRELNHFTSERIGILNAILDGLAAPLENARLDQQLQISMEEMAVVDEIARIMTSSLDTGPVYEQFAAEVKKLIDFDRVILTTIDENNRSAKLAYFDPEGIGSLVQGQVLPLEGTATAHVAKSRQTIMCDDLAESAPFWTWQNYLEEGFRSIIGVPLISKDRVIGVFGLFCRRPSAFGTREKTIVERLASQIAPAIENARLYQEAQERAEEIRRLNIFQQRILGSTPSALAVLKGSERTVVSVNRAFRQTFELGNNVIEGKPISEVLPLGNLEDVIQEVLPTEGGEIQKEVHYTTSEGGERWFMVSATPLCADAEAEAEASAEALLILNDITEQKQHREKLQETARLASIGELAAGVAHEVNNPLAVVLGFSQLVLDQDLPLSTKEDVVRIHEHTQRAMKVMENLLAFARRHRPEQRYIDVTVPIADAMELKAHEFAVSNVQVTFEPSPDLPHTMADEHQLQQVFLNIIANAGEAMVETHGRGTLHISAMQVDNKLRLSFTDDGPGISPENLNKIFDPFFTTKEVGKGTGLGLSICYGIIREHDGDIWAKSRPDKGTTIHVELPIVSPDALLESTTPDTPANQTIRQHILVVDDEAGMRELLHRGLTDAGHTVDVSSDGQEAWDMIQENSYDCIIADLKMPGMSGQRLFKLVKNFEPDLAGKIAFITGDTVSSDVREFLEATGNLVLHKPFGLEEILRRIQEFPTLTKSGVARD